MYRIVKQIFSWHICTEKKEIKLYVDFVNIPTQTVEEPPIREDAEVRH